MYLEKRWRAVEKLRLNSPKKGKASLSLHAQITQLQADAAIYTATADLESKGFDLGVAESRDAILRRLDELEAEMA